MADSQYDIYFRGEVLPGQDVQQVKQAVAAIFKANDAKLAQLFSGKLHTIKKSVDKATASKYQQAFKKAGAKAVITLAKPSNEKLSNEKPNNEKLGNEKPGSDWNILPAGSDLLKPEERQQTVPVEVDISAIKMQSPFADPEAAHEDKPLPVAPNTDHISVAAVGEDMNPDRPAPAVEPDIDLSEFSIAEVGAELVEKKPKDILPVPSTDHIKLL